MIERGLVYEVVVNRITDNNLNDIRRLFVTVDLGLLDQILVTNTFTVMIW